MKHCHPLASSVLVDRLKTGPKKSEYLCKLLGSVPLLCLVVAHKQRFSGASARKRGSPCA